MAKKAKKQKKMRKGTSVEHIGFEAAAEQAAEKAGVSKERGRAIVAASSRAASAAAKKRNPRLKRVKGKAKKKR